MITSSQLNSWLGKNISDICLNGYAAANLNHCGSVYVGHTRLPWGYTCRNATGSQNFGGEPASPRSI
jgi:hypothetical protein